MRSIFTCRLHKCNALNEIPGRESHVEVPGMLLGQFESNSSGDEFVQGSIKLHTWSQKDSAPKQIFEYESFVFWRGNLYKRLALYHEHPSPHTHLHTYPVTTPDNGKTSHGNKHKHTDHAGCPNINLTFCMLIKTSWEATVSKYLMFFFLSRCVFFLLKWMKNKQFWSNYSASILIIT